MGADTDEYYKAIGVKPEEKGDYWWDEKSNQQDPSIAKAANGRWDSSSFGRELDYLENTAKYRISDTVNELGYYYAIPTK